MRSAAFVDPDTAPIERGGGRRETSAAIDIAIGRGVSAGLRYRANEVGLSSSLPLPSRLSLHTTVSRRTGSLQQWSALTVISVPISPRASGTVAFDVDAAGRAGSQASVQRALNLGPGLGYRAQWQTDSTSSRADAAIQYQGRALRLEAAHTVVGDRQFSAATVSGAVVGVDRVVRLAAPVTDAFALVRVARARGVRTYLSNQYVGRTGRAGDLIVPSLSSYNANRIDIDDRDLPVTMDLRNISALVSPALRGGVIVRFDPLETAAADSFAATAQSTVRATADLRTEAGPEAFTAAEATAVWANGEERVRVRADGRVEFTRATIGGHTVTVVGPIGVLTCPLTVTAAAIQSDGTQSIGPVHCRPIAGATARAEGAR